MQDRHGLGTDLRAAVRFCWRHPLLSLTVVLTLAVGIGVNAAVFSVLNATYLKKLPVANAERFVARMSISTISRGPGRGSPTSRNAFASTFRRWQVSKRPG